MPPASAHKPHGPMDDKPAPDYSFLNEQTKRAIRLPLPKLKGQSFISRLIAGVVGFILLVVLFIVVKDLLATSPFSKADYLAVAERQQQMLRILNTDLTSSNIGQLTNSNQDFASTASLALQSAQNQILTLLSEAGDKVSTTSLASIYSSSIDQQITAAASANNLSSVFQSVMNIQLSYYLSELATAYNSSNVSAGKATLRSDYAQAKLLEKALTSSNS